jgi:hypothetical protein
MRVQRHPLGGSWRVVAAAALTVCVAAAARGQEIRVESGSLSAFKGVSRYSFWAADADSHQDLGPVLMGHIQAAVPGATSCLEDDSLHVSVQYQSALSACTHCAAPYKGPRFVFAIAQVRTDCDIKAEVTWVSTTGGSVDELAAQFADQLLGWYRGESGVEE